MEIGGDVDRATLKLIASGKYLDLNKSYNQEQHTQFIEGALFTWPGSTGQMLMQILIQ